MAMPKQTSSRKHQCPQCPLKASCQSKLEVHINSVHLGLKPFKCPAAECEYKAARKDAIRVHLRKVEKWSVEEVNKHFPIKNNPSVSSEITTNSSTTAAYVPYFDEEEEQKQESSDEEWSMTGIEKYHSSGWTPINKPYKMTTEQPSRHWTSINRSANLAPRKVQQRKYSCPVGFCNYSSDRLPDVKRHLGSKPHNFSEDVVRAYLFAIKPRGNEKDDDETEEDENFEVVGDEEDKPFPKYLPLKAGIDEYDYPALTHIPMPDVRTDYRGLSQTFHFKPPVPQHYMGIRSVVRHNQQVSTPTQPEDDNNMMNTADNQTI